MVMSNYSWEEQTRRLLSDAQTEKIELDAKLKELEEKSAEIDAEIDAFKIALGAYLTRTGKQQNTQTDWVTLLNGKSLKEKLIAIATQNGGLLKQSQATDIIFSNKLTTAAKRTTVYQMVKNTIELLISDNVFIKLNPGEYRLVGVQPKLVETTLNK